jgi:hypothetical protein
VTVVGFDGANGSMLSILERLEGAQPGNLDVREMAKVAVVRQCRVECLRCRTTMMALVTNPPCTWHSSRIALSGSQCRKSEPGTRTVMLPRQSISSAAWPIGAGGSKTGWVTDVNKR